MTGKDLTPWFDGTIKPAHKGVYMLLSGLTYEIGFQRWDGEKWSTWYEKPDCAASAPVDDIAGNHYQNDKWRGLRTKARLVRGAQ